MVELDILVSVANTACIDYAGAILAPLSMPTLALIPVPGYSGLYFSFSPQSLVWRSPDVISDFQRALIDARILPDSGKKQFRSSSAFFFQDKSGKTNLRLDFGAVPTSDGTKKITYHWNQEGTFNKFGLENHKTASGPARSFYHFFRTYKYFGRALLFAGLTMDTVSIVTASDPPRRAAEVAGGWVGARRGCSLGGRGAMVAVPFKHPYALAAASVAGCIGGGYLGYQSGSYLAGRTYDVGYDTLVWAKDTIFSSVPQTTVEGYFS